MHDESPGGKATAERTLAAFMDQRNFPQIRPTRVGTNPNTVRSGTGNGFVGRWWALVEHYIDGIDVMLNGKR